MNKKEIDIIERLGYRTLSKLGLGGYGTVFLVEKGGKESVLKIAKSKISKEINVTEIREAVILKQLKSPYIISIGEVNLDVKESYIAIELEKMDNAFSSIEKTKQSVEFYRKMIYSVVQGLFYMHTKGFIHNDIKPQNILLKGNNVKLADFGLCNYLGIPIPNGLTSYCSTDYYKAPDSLGDKMYIDKNRYNYNSDIYSVGALMYWTVMGVPPSKKKQTESINLLTEDYVLNQGLFIEYFGEEGVLFMERCLERNTENRMTSKQALEDPYLKNYKGGSVGNFIRKKYPEVDNYATDYLDDFYENYKDYILIFNRIKESDEYIRLVEQVLEYSLKYNKSLESFIQYVLLFRKAISDFPQKKIDELSFCCFSITNKIYEDTACDVMIKRLLRDIPHKTSEETLIKLELDILNHYRFNVPIMPIYSMIYYYSIKNKKVDINRSYQAAIRVLLSTEINGESTLDELVQFVIQPKKGNKLERLKEDGKRRSLKSLDALEEDIEIEEVQEVDKPKTPTSLNQSQYKSNSEVEVEECAIDGIKYFKDDSGQIYHSDTEELVGKYNWKEKRWIEYKENVFVVYENAMKLYGKGDHINMVRYLEHHIDMFNDKKYLNLRRVILEKAKVIG